MNEKQQQFVNWLKAQGLYDDFESYPIMVKLQRVWEACGSPQPTQKES